MKRARDMNHAIEVPRVGRCSRPTRAAVVVDDAGIEAAIRALRHERDAYGLSRMLNRQSGLFSYYKPSARRRTKSGRARALRRKMAAKRLAREQQRGEWKPRPRGEVISRRAA